MKTVLAVGEVLWDLLPDGPVLGGAPANFAQHVHALGGAARLVSHVGDDALGREILARFAGVGWPAEFVGIDQNLPTGTVSVKLDAAGQASYTIHENVAWDRISIAPGVLAVAKETDAICFGTLAQRDPISRAAIHRLVAATPRAALRVCDINLRQAFYSRELLEASLSLANVLKLNDAELPVLAEMFALSSDPAAQLAELARRFELRAIALTRGASGSLLLAGGEFSEHAGIAAEVRDTIGAGDAFTAAFVFGLLKGWTLPKINQRANEVAAFVCAHAGATPPLPAELRAAFAERLSATAR